MDHRHRKPHGRLKKERVDYPRFIYVYNDQGRYDRVRAFTNETELRMVWDSLVLPSVQARRDVWITDIGNLMVN